MPLPANQTQQLADYIKRNLSKGYTIDSLKFSLLSQGYGRTAVLRAIETANKQLATQAPKMKEHPQIIRKVFNNQVPANPSIEKNSGFFNKLKNLFG